MIQLKAGDVLFVWGNDWVSEAIAHVTGGPAHVALVVDDVTVSEAQVGRHIGERPLTDYTSTADRLEIWRDETLTDDERQRMIEYSKTLYGLPYDYALIPLEFAHFELGVDIGWYHERRGRICSTYVCEVATSVGRQWSEVPNPAPVDDQSRKLTKLYDWEGDKWSTVNTANV